MKPATLIPRLAIAALSAAIVLPIAPVFGQETASPPPVVTITPPPMVVTPPPPVSTAPPAVRPAPPPATRAAPPPAIDEPVARAPRTARAAPRVRAAAPVRRAAPAPVATAPAATPAPVPAPAPAAEIPVTEAPEVAPADTAAVPVETPAAADNSRMIGLALAAVAILIAGLAFFAWRRRRARAEDYEEAYDEQPVTAAAEPIAEAPAAAAMAASPDLTYVPATAAIAEEASIEDADQADVDALAADSAPVAGRPWLEFLLRPVRAGTSQDDTIVQFELTVGNTGSVAAKDVRISTWMFAAGPGTDMERSLIEPPADATVSEVDIAAGDGARVEGEIALPKSGSSDESVLPVVVADARYRLPDGSEGRTRASFEIGLPEGDHLAPFPADRASGLMENVEARLHGVPERV